jgi:glycosyltransferase involved in cell wall biosynthesis
MHVAFLITRGEAVGGATVHVRDMARHLLQSGEQATVLIGGCGEAVDELVSHGIPYRSIDHLQRRINPLQDFLAVVEIVRVLREVSPDLVSTHTAKAGWLGRIASRIVGLPALFTPHGWAISDRISRTSGHVFALAEWLAAPLAATIVNVCEAEREIARRRRIAPYSKLAVIHNGVRDVPSTLRADPRRQPPRLVMVARFEEPKDHATLLHALAALRGFEWELELIGGGPKQTDIRRLAEQLGLSGRIHLTGQRDDVAARLAQAQAFVLVSRSEGFPRSILEAMRAGLPVMASNVGGVAEAVRDGVTGFVVPRDDRCALLEALRVIVTDPELRLRLGRAGRRQYELNFTFGNMCAKTLALYDDILIRTGKARLRAETSYGVH